ncbi:sensor domain-containing protein [Streptomyces caeruleatus]|uniref:Putative sensor domain-containing protein n=1 Tax=Streptomyces caeruleatus TaxID=661399 RepID=A0A117RLL0_9ACTN|nr:sensor domain-containing protein [Streptomyces caeruleatus]KUN97545.1 hypothetical protein AQJ67_29435 [Streptomyces caeruleatus]
MDRAKRLGGNRPADESTGPGGFSVTAGWVGLRRALTLCWTATAALGRSLSVCGAISLMGPGLGLVPRAMEGIRDLAARRRALALRWSGVEIPGPPGPLPPVPEGASGVVARYRWIMSDPQTRREYVWVLVDPLAGALLAFLPLALVLSGVWGIFLAFFGVPLSAEWDGLWYQFVPIEGQATAVLAGVLGVLQLPLALWAAPRVVRRHALYTRAMLAPSESELMAGRIQGLSGGSCRRRGAWCAHLRRCRRLPTLRVAALLRLAAGRTRPRSPELMRRRSLKPA